MTAPSPPAFAASPTSPAPRAEPSALATAADRYARRVAASLRAATAGTPLDRRLLAVPDVTPSCHVLLLDPLVGDLSKEERDGLLAFVRSGQDPETGAWLGDDGAPDLSRTVLGWWTLVQYGIDPDTPALVRAARTVRRLGGAQRSDVTTRLWLALAGAIPWSFLPSIPAELWLAPDGAALSPTRIAPWARDVLTAYFLLSRAAARVHLVVPHDLLLRRDDGSFVPPRLTRPGLAGDLLQLFDRGVKLARKIPRGPLLDRAVGSAKAWLDRSQSNNGGWFGSVATVLSILALRAHGARSNDRRVLSALAYLRAARGRPGGEDAPLLAQGLAAVRTSDRIPLLLAASDDAELDRLLDEELDTPGPWKLRADVARGGFPFDEGGTLHVDNAATALAIPLLQQAPRAEDTTVRAMAAIRRATAVVVAMQEHDGSFARFERGETRPPLQHLPWQDADHLAHGRPFDEEHLWVTGHCLSALARTGHRAEDDRIARSVSALDRHPVESRGLRTVAALVVGLSAFGIDAPVRRALEHRLRATQREDGGFGDVATTAMALDALLDAGGPCVQADRAARYLADRADTPPPPSTSFGLGLTHTCRCPAEPDALAARALARYADLVARPPSKRAERTTP